MTPALTDEQIERYSRQIVLPEVGGRGQQRLLAASVAVVGAGNMGRTAATYLTAAGIGRLAIVASAPFDVDDRGAGTATLGDNVAAALRDLNPDCRIRVQRRRLDTDHAGAVARRHGIVVDASERPESSRLLNRACVDRCVPIVWGRRDGRLGVATVFAGHSAAPCYQCLTAVPSDATSPLATLTAAFIGTLLATEVVKLVVGMECALIGRLLTYDAFDMRVQDEPIAKNRRCPVCTSSTASATPSPQ